MLKERVLELRLSPHSLCLKGNLEGTEYLSKPPTNKGKEDGSIGKEDKKADSSNRIAEEVYAQQPKSVVHFVAYPDFYDFDRDIRVKNALHLIRRGPD